MPTEPMSPFDRRRVRAVQVARRAACAALALALATPVPPAQAQPAPPSPSRLPALGEAAAQDFDLTTERRLGDQIMRSVRQDPAYLDDPLLLEGLQSLWAPLVAAARARGEIGADLDQRFAFESFLVEDRSVNAFALPGGFVGVHLGLIAMTGSADELASVLAHELSHVTQRHIARSLDNAGRQGLVGTAALLLGLILAARSSNIDAAQAVVVGGQAAIQQGQINFSREMEREADRIGFEVLVSAGFAPAGMAGMFEKLDAANRLNDAGLFPYLRSHPLTVERISEARLRAGNQAAPLRPSLAHALMQSRARVLMDRSVDALRRLQAQGQQAGSPLLKENLAALYAGALASTLLREFDRADALLDRLDDLATSGYAGDAALRRQIALLRTHSLVQRGDAPAARLALERLGDDDSRPALLMRAQVMALALRKGDVAAAAGARQSLEQMQSWLSVRRSDALAWSTAAQLAEAMNLPLRALRAQAESVYASGDLMGAIDRMRAAQRAARQAVAADFVDQSIIDARLREWEAERRQLMAQGPVR